MHETSIAASILETAQGLIREQGEGRLESVKVAVGELSAVEPDLLVFAWEALISGTSTPDAALEIEWSPAQTYCPTCNRNLDRARGSWLRLCSKCGDPVVTKGGDELDIVQISFIQEDSNQP
ncbi:MAG: hydrogenase maturation nickel metallochaperone HypA [Acidobacteriota bacterium]|nr:MAG: hydrogenase maturation nickel metallochaperone HypA [Acidobacteriota bacterium]